MSSQNTNTTDEDNGDESGDGGSAEITIITIPAEISQNLGYNFAIRYYNSPTLGFFKNHGNAKKFKEYLSQPPEKRNMTTKIPHPDDIWQPVYKEGEYSIYLRLSDGIFILRNHKGKTLSQHTSFPLAKKELSRLCEEEFAQDPPNQKM